MSTTGLREYLDGPHKAARDLVRDGLAANADLLDAGLGLSRAEYRDKVLEVMQQVTAEGHTSRGFPKEFGGQGDLGGFIAGFETLAFGDLSLMVKAGVQFGLFAGAILHLGTSRHHEEYLTDALEGRLLGCFAMTETGHGSNVQALGTTATYDPATEEFVVHTPTAAARKDYIGNAARHGRMATVFAQLVVGGESHGVHCLLVPIRTTTASRCRRHPDRLRPEARPERGRQRPDRFRPGPRAPHRTARPLRAGRCRGHLLQ